MKNVIILDTEYNKTYTIPETWAIWAKQAIVIWDNRSGDGEEWFEFADTCPYPDTMDEDLLDLLTDGGFKIVN